MSDPGRKFKGVWIPADIWLDRGLSVNEKVMLMEIDSLQDEVRGCFASNQRFASFFDLSISRVSEIISSLASKGLVEIVQIREGKRVIERRIFVKTPFDKPKTPSENAANPFGKGDEPPSEKAKERNTSLNNTGTEESPNSSETQSSVKSVQHEQIRELYNSILGGKLPRCLGLTDKHRTRLRACSNLKLDDKFVIREGGLSFWEGLFNDVLDCPFLLGGNGRSWSADFEFLTTSANIQKFMEGKYDAR